MSEMCFVLFPELARCTVRTAIVCLDSLQAQLKRKDPNAAVQQIVLADDSLLQFKVSEKSIGVHYTASFSEQQGGPFASCSLLENSSVAFVIEQVELLKRQLYPWILQRGWYQIKGITFKDGLLTIEREAQMMTFEKLRKSMFPGQPPSKLLLIDGSNLLCEGYYATSKNEKELQRNAAGLYTNGVYAMVRRILWLLRDYRPTHLAICWDVSRESLFRRQLYPEYKGLREKKPASLEEQYETAWQLFEKMNIPQFEVQGYEADDLLGTIAHRWKEEVGDPCYLVSSDHDLYQLLDENVSILRHKKGQGDSLYTRSDFVKEYSIEPRQWIDVKALLGEPGKGDNIPGVKHVGEDGAFPLIQQYGCIENLYNNIHELEGTKFKRYIKHLLRDSETAAISKKLVRIVTDVPELQSTQMDELTLRIDKAAMIGEFQRLGFKTILNEIAEGKYKAS